MPSTSLSWEAFQDSAQSGALASQVGVPFWVMLIGAVGISLGLFLFGPRIVRIVGEKITKMNPMRAFCVALSAAVTVLVASQLGLPVSTTHIVVGAVFGVGFSREYYTTHSRRRRNYIARTSAMRTRGAPFLQHRTSYAAVSSCAARTSLAS